MAENKTKIDRIHDQMPRIFKTRTNPNWKALIEAIGGSDQDLSDLIEEVRKQFFIKTASRPYIDRLGSNYRVSRPKFVGMDDPTFRTYIPVLAYQPKQVKIVLDLLLDIFFFKSSTTAFTQSDFAEPFTFLDGWELEYLVDQTKAERIVFSAAEFVNINAATAEEIVSAINRQAQFSFAIVFDDRIQKKKFIRIFTDTIGSKGSIQITGGRADMALQFQGFNHDAGSGTNTVWTVTKIGDTATFQHTAGVSPNLNRVEAGDVVIIDIPGNVGSFVVESVDLANNKFSFTNLFATVGVFDSFLIPNAKVSFMKAEKIVIYSNNSRAVVWEVSPGEIIVEMPASPPVVKRSLIGSAHINGVIGNVVDRPSASQLELIDASEFPSAGGQFVLKELSEIQTHILTSSEDAVLIKDFNNRFDISQIYSFTGKTGNILTGVAPDLPQIAALYEKNITSAFRDNTDIVTVTTSTNHGFNVGEVVRIQNTAGVLPSQGVRITVLTTDTPTQVATKTATVLNGISDFGVTTSLGSIFVTNSDNGVTVDAVDVNSGSTVTVTQQGTSLLPEITQVDLPSGAALNAVGFGLYWTINSAQNVRKYHVWYDVTNGNNEINPSLDDTVDGSFIILSTPSANSFTYQSGGEEGTAFGGVARVERIGMAASGSLAYLTSANINTGVTGPYMWDLNAPYVISSLTSTTQAEIKAGNNVRTLLIDPVNNIPNQEGFVVFGFGTEFEEGPIRYLYKPTPSSLQLDPAYVFKNNHEIGSSITVIRRKGAHVMSGIGSEYPPYITDPAVARAVLQQLMTQAKSVGIFIEFLVRYPQQLYNTLDVYKSGNKNLLQINDEEKAKLL